MIYFLASVAAIAGFLFGYDEGVIAVARASLEKDIPMSALVGGFMTAAVPLGALVAASVAGPITDRFGRRSVLMGAAALFAIGALMAASIDTVLLLVIARFVLGIAIGMAAVAAPLYIAECAPLESRGAMVSTYQLAITVGILVSYLAGVAIHDEAAKGMWRIMFGLGIVPGLLFLAGLALLPESPRWLVRRERLVNAKASLLRACAGRPAMSMASWPEMDRSVKAELNRPAGYGALLEPAVRPALIVGIGLFFLQQLSGINAVIYYAPEIFAHAGFDGAKTQVLATIGVGVVNVATTVLAMFLIDRLGRRPLLIIGFLGAAITMLIIALGVVFPDSVPSWLIIAMLLLYIASFAIAIGPLPHLLMSEIFPLRVRGPGMSMASLSNWGFNFLVVFPVPWMLAGPGLAYTFTVFAVICLGGIGFTLSRVPETTGHSLEAIERHLLSGKPLGSLRRGTSTEVRGHG